MRDLSTTRPRSKPAAGLMLAAAAAAAIVAVRQMNGMDMGVATGLGSFTFFAGAWTAMMAAMMLPGAIPAALRHRARAVPAFAASYLAVWALAGLAVYAVYEPHGTTAAGLLTIAAGLYELTPLKRWCRCRCRDHLGSGFGFGLACLGSSIGLMVLLLALGAMSVAWSCVVAAVVLGQKLTAPRAVVDVPVALTVVALGTVVAVVPSVVPGLN